jgi:hypothetical protein
MPGYVKNALHKFRHPQPERQVDAPHIWNKPTYGALVQYAPQTDQQAQLPAPEITKLQQKVGTLLYYSIAVGPTMLVALGTIAANQSKATAMTANAVVKLLNYAATHPGATIRYRRSDMVLYLHSNTSYLSVSKAWSRAVGHFFLSDVPPDPTKPPLNHQQARGHSTPHAKSCATS